MVDMMMMALEALMCWICTVIFSMCIYEIFVNIRGKGGEGVCITCVCWSDAHFFFFFFFRWCCLTFFFNVLQKKSLLYFCYTIDVSLFAACFSLENQITFYFSPQYEPLLLRCCSSFFLIMECFNFFSNVHKQFFFPVTLWPDHFCFFFPNVLIFFFLLCFYCV